MRTDRSELVTPELADPIGSKARVPLTAYLGRMRGSPRTVSQQRRMSAVPLTFAGTFIGIYLISIPALFPSWPLSTKLFLVGSFGASAVLLFAAPRAEFARKRRRRRDAASSGLFSSGEV